MTNIKSKVDQTWKVLISERSTRKRQQIITQILEDKLTISGNDKNIANDILKFIYKNGKCNKCECYVHQLNYHRRYKMICNVCKAKYKP